MKKIKVFYIIFFVFALNFNAQNTVGKIEIKEGVSPGYTLFSAHKKSFLVDNCGQIINEWESNFTPGNAVYLLQNGNLLRTGKENGKSDITFGGQGGVVEIYNWERNLIWSYSFNDNQSRQHHDVFPMPNGNILVLLAEAWSKEDAIAAGRDPSKILGERLYNEKIIEIEPIGTNQFNLVWEWNINEHLIQDFDNSKSNFGIVENNPQKLDVNFLNGGGGEANWLHVNSIQYNSKLDQIIISSRNLSEFWVIDHSTIIIESQSSSGGKYGKGGDLLYRWGNPQSYKRGSDNDRILFGQHSPNFIIKNNEFTNDIIVFNNGRDRNPLFSEVLKIKPPIDENGFYSIDSNVPYLPANPFYNYSDLSSNPSEFYSGILSSAQVLPNDNILICEGINGEFFEINNNKEIVWKYISPVNNSNGTIYDQGQEPQSNTSFRATKYALDYGAFDGRDLSGTETIENGSDNSSCNTLSLSTFNTNDFALYPNPTSSGEVFIKNHENIDSIEVFSSIGKKVLKYNKTDRINLKGLSKGLYIIKFKKNNLIETQKILFY